MQAFILWQAGVGLAYVLAARAASGRILGRGEGRYDWRQLGRIWRFPAGVGAITVAGIVLSHIDKLILSKMLGLPEYGQYMLAVAIAGSLYLFSAPLFNVLYPRFSVLVHSGDAVRLAAAYRFSTRLLGALVFPLAMLFAVFSQDLIQAWTGDPALASSVGPLLPMLAIGTALHCVMYVPYALQLAHGMTRLPLTISALLLVAVVPLTILLAAAYGAYGGALAWLALHVLYAALGAWMTHRHLLKGLGARWLGLDVGIPLGLAAVVGLAARYLSSAGGLDVYARLGCGAAWALFAFALTVAVSPALRAAALEQLRALAQRAPERRAT
jgi:O-antigen/teichoic acid export membrane protein